MKRPTGASVGTSQSLAHLYHLAQLDTQRPGNIGAGLKVLEALLTLPHFRPATGGKA
ncbi:hypothetical protein V3W47_10790 [Deinococcus sp. YIM 134068]|uniref:hypothetical protein n=1 Tax=Deinococcus lichenicola TaxID=3118910 RepID=UPI002F92D86D